MTSYSHSRLETFERCPKRYQFAYVVKPDIAPEETIEAFMGSRAHDALEWLYRERQMARTPSLDGLLQTYGSSWDREWHEGVRVVRPEYGPDDYRKVGEEALAKYHARYAPFDGAVTVGIEQRVEIPIDPDGRYRMVGFIDRLDRVSDGVYEIHDYKTSGSLPEQAKFDADRQLALYQLAVQEMWPDVREVSLVWHYLRFDAEIRSKRNLEELESLRSDTLELIRTVDGLVAEAERAAAEGADPVEAWSRFEPRTSSLCDWCEYQTLCPARAHLTQIRQLTLEDLPSDDGVELVNRYIRLEAELKERRSALEGELAPVEEEKQRVADAIIEFARANELAMVYGQGHAIRVWTKQAYKFPDREHPDRPELERAMKETGLWERVSDFSAFRASRLLEEGDLPAQDREALARWGKQYPLVKLYPRRSGSRAR